MSKPIIDLHAHCPMQLPAAGTAGPTRDSMKLIGKGFCLRMLSIRFPKVGEQEGNGHEDKTSLHRRCRHASFR